MAPLTLRLSFLWLFFGRLVFAGSHIWQPALGRRDNNGTSTSSELDKRYYYVNPDTQVTDRVPWPNRKIRYCFSPDDVTQGAKSNLKKYLKDAHKIWIAEGLNSNFKIDEVTDSVCQNDRNEVLMIFYTGPTGGMGTYVGFPGSGVVMPSNAGPSMRLTDRTDIGMLDVVANYAHELGHAWGLYHEHQNPKFWAGVDGADNGEVWGPDNPGGFNCVNLKDYTQAVTGLVVQTGGGGYQNLNADKLCKNYGAAINKGFSAYDYLPMPNVGVSHSAGHSTNDVDWDSLMLYPSGAGGAVSGTGTVTEDNDIRLPILIKPDGSKIGINKKPSQVDIAALHAMYGNIEGTSKLSLLNKLKTFKSSYKSSGSGPSGGSGCL